MSCSQAYPNPNSDPNPNPHPNPNPNPNPTQVADLLELLEAQQDMADALLVLRPQAANPNPNPNPQP